MINVYQYCCFICIGFAIGALGAGEADLAIGSSILAFLFFIGSEIFRRIKL